MKDDADAALTALTLNRLPSLLAVNIGWYGPDRFTEPATHGSSPPSNVDCPPVSPFDADRIPGLAAVA